METMWAPWRIEYILNEKEDTCIFCEAGETQADYTLYRGKLTLALMNKFPYINGHLLIAPVRHLAALDELNHDEMGELMALMDKTVGILKRVMKPDGFNIGLNLGRVAGAGIEEHLHFHIVPRWFGDVNAFTVFGEVRVIPEHFRRTYHNLKPHFDKLESTILN